MEIDEFKDNQQFKIVRVDNLIMEKSKEITIHRIFVINLIIKAIDGFSELVGGLLLLFVSSKLITRFVKHIFYGELVEDPNDFVANYLLTMMQHLSRNAQLFGAVYLLIHAFINLGVAIALFSRKLWAYPIADATLLLFIAYQIFRFTQTHSVFLLFLTLLDIIIIVLSLFEYKHIAREIA